MYFYHVCTTDFKKSNWKANTFHTEIYSIQSSWLDRVHPKSEFAHFCLLYKILFQLQQVVWVAVQVHSHNTIEVKDQFNNLYWLTDHSNLWNERDRLIPTMTTTIKVTHARRFFLHCSSFKCVTSKQVGKKYQTQNDVYQLKSKWISVLMLIIKFRFEFHFTRFYLPHITSNAYRTAIG